MGMFEGNNFINNNFYWFTGVIEDINDPLEMGRVRVRCYGYHTDDKNEGTGIPTGALPWSHVMMPVTSASCSGIGESATGLLPGSWVVGFFRDGDACQDPLVIGTLPSKTPNPIDRTKGFCDPNPAGNPRDANYIDNPKGSTMEYRVSAAYQKKHELRSKTKYATPDNDSPSGVPTAIPPGTETLKVQYPDVSGKPDKFFEVKTFIQPEQKDICRPEYPNCHTKETKSGHTIELDDTRGVERTLHYHKSGTFDETDSTGTKTTVVVGDGYEVYFKDKSVNVKGNCNLTINGEVRTLVKGDYYLEVEGNHYTNIHGMKHERVNKSDYREVIKDMKENIGGLLTTRIGQNEKRTIGANMKDGDSPTAFNQDIEIFGNQDIQINVNKTESIDGVYDLGVDGDTSMTFNQKWNVTTGGDLTINSQAILDVDATGKITIDTQNDMDLHTASGTVDIDGSTAINLN